MYFIERNDNEIIVHGPQDFEQTVPANAVSIVVRMDGDFGPQRYAVPIREMNDAEILGCILGLPAFPSL